MAESIVLETTFIIDLEREASRSLRGPATLFLEKHLEAPVYITFITAGELACGVSMERRARWEQFLQPFDVLGFNLDVAWEYGKAFRYLKQNGLLIGTNDLWIAATTMARDLPLATRNVSHFRRVPGLIVLGY